jgi:hypothetical protein
MVPELVMPVAPVITPAVEISNAVESMATVFDPPPIETAPFEVPVPTLIAKLEETLRSIAPPEEVMAPVFVIPRTSVIAPEVFISKRSPLPTVKSEAGEASPIPTLPVK